MQKLLEQFVVAPIASQQIEEDMTNYYDEAGQLVASVYQQDEYEYSATFYGEQEQPPITKQEAEEMAKHVQVILQQENLNLKSVQEHEGDYVVEFKYVEPVYQLTVKGTGLYVTISRSGFVKGIKLFENDVTICYPDKMIPKDEASAILKEQPILQLGIARTPSWQYVYKQNYDLTGIYPDGKVRLWSEEESMQDAGFEPLPNVETIDDFEAFLTGNRNVVIEEIQTEDEQRWAMETEEQVYLEENAFLRACRVVKHLVGDAYNDYYIEQYPTLRKLLKLDEFAFMTFRFVYNFEGISLESQAISVSVNTETNQIVSICYPFIPYEALPTLPKPTLTLEQANAIAKQQIDVELILEYDLVDDKKRSFVYGKEYPNSPTGGPIHYVDGFTGEIHWTRLPSIII